MTNVCVDIDTSLKSHGRIKRIKREMTPKEKKEIANEHIDEKYVNHLYRIFTDGSKKESLVASGFYIENQNIKAAFAKRLDDRLSSNVAELTAISDSLTFLLRDTVSRNTKVLILSDSLSMLNYLKSNPIEDLSKKQDALIDLKNKIYQMEKDLRQREIYLTIVWIPAHCDIKGNTIADNVSDMGRYLKQKELLEEINPLCLATDTTRKRRRRKQTQHRAELGRF